MEAKLFCFLPSMSLGSCKSLKTCASFGLSCCVSVFLQLQKRKEREEQLEDVIQAYEKIHMEKSNLQRDLDKMVRHLSAHHVTLMAKNQPLMRAKWSLDSGSAPFSDVFNGQVVCGFH